MKVLVLGAGVIGVSTAYYLAKDGHDVTVIDRQPQAGLETSYANGGQISASHAMPWAAPDSPKLMLKWLGRNDAPLLFHMRLDPAQWAWSLRFLVNCRPGRFRENTAKNLRLALYSRSLMTNIRAETDFAYDRRGLGILQIFRQQKNLDRAALIAEELGGMGSRSMVLDEEETKLLEPALENSSDRIIGSIHTPEDESGDAYMFTIGLAEAAATLGVTFRYGETVTSIGTSGQHITDVTTDAGNYSADAVVLCLGSYSTLLAKSAGVKIPIYPTKGYSITLPVNGSNAVPSISLTDEDNRLVFSRLGDRLRVAGMAEFNGYDTEMNESRARMIVDVTRAMFPQAGDYNQVEFWTGLRPLTPDGVPILGRARYDNFYLNTGHGTLGWTMAAGSARITADLISCTTPEIDLPAYSATRF